MVVQCNLEAQWATEMKNIYDYVLQSFEVAVDTVETAEEKVEAYVYSICNLSAEARKMISEKITDTEWNASLHALEKCVKEFDKYLNLVNSGFESFNVLICLTAGNVNEMFLEITEKVIELFITVQIETEDHMKEVEEIIEKVASLSTSDED